MNKRCGGREEGEPAVRAAVAGHDDDSVEERDQRHRRRQPLPHLRRAERAAGEASGGRVARRIMRVCRALRRNIMVPSVTPMHVTIMPSMTSADTHCRISRRHALAHRSIGLQGCEEGCEAKCVKRGAKREGGATQEGARVT